MDQKKTHVLLVDDDPQVAKALTRVLTREGYEVTIASGGLEAVGLLPKRTWSLVLTDLHMPDLNGVDVARAVLERAPSLPVAIMTGTPDSEHFDEATALLGRPPIPKPLGPRELAETVAGLLTTAGRQIGVHEGDPRTSSSSPPPPSGHAG